MLYPSNYGRDPLFPQSKDFQVVNKNPTIGKGVFCYRSFKKGEVIAKLTGEIVPDIRQHTLQINERNHLFDVYFSGYFLHSCEPNIYLDMKELTVTAINKIQQNSYLYMDYSQTEDVLYKQFSCNCGSENCREWIVGKNEIPVNYTQNHLKINNEGTQY